MARSKPTVIIKDKPKARSATFVKRDPVPETITESYLVEALQAMYYGVFKELPKTQPLATMNTLLQELKSPVRVVAGCGAAGVRDALVVLTEEYNRYGETR